MKKSSKIFVAGARGLVGSALVRQLKEQGYTNLLTPNRDTLDLTLTSTTAAWFREHKPEYVFLAAAKVGGILANSTYPVDFLYQNLRIQDNVFQFSQGAKLLFLGSSCIYPKRCEQPIKEEYLLTGSLESSNIAYAIAKISGVIGCSAYRKQYGDNFICAMPTNLYGPNDNFDLKTSHVLPAMIRKFHEALPNKPVILWGSGSPKREFLHVDDCAKACIHLMNTYSDPTPVNVGVGKDISIKELAEMVASVVGHQGEIIWDGSKPDGTPRKLLDTSKINRIGWAPTISLREGIETTYLWFKENE
jgi:GDP-L-fucose synthase